MRRYWACALVGMCALYGTFFVRQSRMPLSGCWLSGGCAPALVPARTRTFTEIEKVLPFSNQPNDRWGDSGNFGACSELRFMEATVFCAVGSFADPQSSAIDGGAHWGETLRLMEAALPKTVPIYSFEAIEGNLAHVSPHNLIPMGTLDINGL